MARTTVLTGDNLTRKLWDEKLFIDTVKESYFFPRFANSSGTTVVHVKTNLEGVKGDNVTFGIRMRLNKAFIVNGQSEGFEHSLTTNDFNVSLSKYRVPVRDDGELTRKRPIWDVEKESRQAIMEDAAEKIDELIFTTLTASPTRLFYAAAVTTPLTTAVEATAKSGLTTSSLIWPKLISFAKTWALTGGNRTQTPLSPIKVDGKSYLILLIHPDVRYDLANDSTMATAHREARERGKENPIFTGADFIWDGVVIHSHESVPIATDAGSGSDVPWSKNILMGRQALVWAWGRRPKVVKKTFDYEDQIGFDWSMVAGTGKPIFDGTDFGSVAFYTARTQISDA